MKKLVLSIITLATSIGFANAQFTRNPATGTATGLSFAGTTAGSNVTTANIANWGAFTPAFANSTCTVYSGAYLGGGGATTAAGPKDTTNAVAYVASGVMNQFDNYGGSMCYPDAPASFSFALKPAVGVLDLSSSANQILTLTVKSNVSFTINLLLQTAGYAAINTSSQPPIHILGDNTFHTYSLKFDTCTFTASKTSVASVAFVYNSATALNGEFYVSGMTIGSSSTPCTSTTLTPNIATPSTSGLTATLTGSNTGGTASFNGWNFNDGSATVTTAVTSHTYTTAGTYTPTYTVYDACGTAYTATSSVTVTAPVSAVSDAQAKIASSKIYPNPGTDIINVELNLKSASDVKITLSDIMGKEIMTIVNGSMTSMNEQFSVANLHKGIYTVNYFINGSAAKAELLMVK